ncbi:MAG: metal-sensitive transcriptional regulator [Polyangiaceae bacterium]
MDQRRHALDEIDAGCFRYAFCKAFRTMDDAIRKEARTRLKRVAGQVGGIQRMLDEDRYCVDILPQIAAIQAAVGEIGRLVLTNHIESVSTQKIDEVTDIFGRYCLLGPSHRPGGASKNGAPRL